MLKTMRLIFVRHGESEANIERVFSNRGSKHPLTPRGIEQAHVLAGRLSGHVITRLYASPLLRAVQTAQILAQSFGVPVVVDKALCEWDVGIYEDTDDPRGWEMHSQVQADWFVHKRLDARMPEGESFGEIEARFVPFVQKVIEDSTHADETVLLVGHGGIFHAMLPHMLTNVDSAFVMQHPFDNTAYALVESRPQGLHCLEWCGLNLKE